MDHNTVKRIALASPDCTLDLSVRDDDLAHAMNQIARSDREANGRDLWVVDVPDGGQCWAVSMPRDIFAVRD